MTHLSHDPVRRRTPRIAAIGLVLAATLGCSAPVGHAAAASGTSASPLAVSFSATSPPVSATNPNARRPSPHAAVTSPPVAIAPAEADQVAGPATGPAVSCTAAAVKATVAHFMTAFNAGDAPVLQQLWARTDQGFVWYLDGGQSATSRASLGSFFTTRHAHHEVLRLTSFQFTRFGDQGGANFSITLTRSTDGKPAMTGWGKGVANCTTDPLKLTVLAV